MSGFTATFTWHVLSHQPKQVQQIYIYITKQILGTSFPSVFITSPDDTKGRMSCFFTHLHNFPGNYFDPCFGELDDYDEIYLPTCALWKKTLKLF